MNLGCKHKFHDSKHDKRANSKDPKRYRGGGCNVYGRDYNHVNSRRTAVQCNSMSKQTKPYQIHSKNSEECVGVKNFKKVQ